MLLCKDKTNSMITFPLVFLQLKTCPFHQAGCRFLVTCFLSLVYPVQLLLTRMAGLEHLSATGMIFACGGS
jgi:hypothetical protein